MSLTPQTPQQPHAPSPPPHLWRKWLEEEWQHWGEISQQTHCLLIGLSLILFICDPLLPITAYMLQRWAASTWAWRDRWTSVWIWAKQSVWFLATIMVLTLLATTHIWMFPQLIAGAQTIWQQILPGDLSLSLSDEHDLIARSLLLLPLAPTLALVYERIDSRTYVQLHRVLTPADLEPKPPSPNPPKQTPPSATAPADTPRKTPRKTTRTKKQKPRKTNPAPAAHVTIDSFLDHPDPTTPPQAAPSAQPEETQQDQPSQKKKQHASPHQPTKTTISKPIDWDDVAE